MKFEVGDKVRVDNGVKLKVNGKPLVEYVGEITRVADDFLFIDYPGFNYTAHKEQCRSV